ncbi:MAG: SDR family oxidoreductase [Alphaproteobacteria bacterium]|nr:SDR family oxidoreductase [Alphaproteobacteria bacterium]
MKSEAPGPRFFRPLERDRGAPYDGALTGQNASRGSAMDLGLKGKVALVTGASKGIGKGIVLELAREGCRVAVSARGKAALAETKREAEALGAECLTIAADATDKNDNDRVVDETLAAWGRLDVLVNNAGGEASIKRSLEQPDAEWAHIYDLNLWSCIRTTRRAIATMKEQGGGTVINISSVGGHSGFSGMGDYNSAKAAMLSLTKTWAQDYGPTIRVNCINPAFIRTPLWEELALEFIPHVGKDKEEVFRNLAKDLPMKRTGKPEEVGAAVAFLASDRKAGFITGVCWNVDGGYTKFIT